MELLEYLLVLRRRRFVIIVIFVAAVVSAALASFIVTPVYQASTSVLVKSESKAAQLPFDLSGMMGDLGKNEIQNYIEVLKSTRLAAEVAVVVGIDPDKEPARLQALRSSIAIQPVQGTDVVRISVQSTDPKFAQRVANKLVSKFQEWCKLRNQQDASAAKVFIGQQLHDQEKELEANETALQVFKSAKRVVAPDEQTRAQITNVVALEAEQATTRIELEAARVKLLNVTSQLKRRDKTYIASTTIQKDPLLQQYLSELDRLERELAAAREKYTDQHPKVEALVSQIADTKRRLNEGFADVVSSKVETVNPIYQDLLREAGETQVVIVSLQAKLDALSSTVAAASKKLESVPITELEYTRLTRKKEVAEKIYIMLLEKLNETQIAEAQQTAKVDVIDSASLPESPIKPKKKLNIAIAGFLGLFVGCGLAFMLEYMDTSIKTAEDIERYLEVPVMGVIPLMKESGGGKPSKRTRRAARSPVEGTDTTTGGGVPLG